MSERKTSIHINGKQYDAVTGRAMHAAAKAKPATTASKPAATSVKPSAAPASRSIDGMVSGTKVRPVPVPRKTAAHTKAHAVKPSATLMRSVVAKPAKQSLKRRAKTQSPMVPQHAVPQTVQLAKKLSAHTVNDKRLARASRVTTSPKISRFSFSQEVAAATQAIEQAVIVPTTPTLTHHVRATIVPEPTQHTTTDAIFQQAILRATSHEQPAPKVRGARAKRSKATRAVRRRMATYGASAAVLLALVGFLGYLNAATIEFKLAANKAGFAATMPSYKPTGYTLHKVSANPGSLGVEFVADQVDGTHRFAITEKPSNWSEHDVLSNLVMDSGVYQTIEQGGRTVYAYGQNQAAWVSDGVLYQVSADHKLGAQEIGQLAASM